MVRMNTEDVGGQDKGIVKNFKFVLLKYLF